MFNTIIAIIVVTISITAEGQVSVLSHLNYMASQSQYAIQGYGQAQTQFSMDNIMAGSIEMALQNCQNSFRWDRWNCPESDFFLRRNTKSLLLDREDAYINAITTASVLYAITKNCSSGIIAECRSCPDNRYSSQCSDNPQAADKLFRKQTNSEFADDFYGKISKHNYRSITNLLEKSLVNQCTCSVMAPNGICLKEMCLQILKPFENIAEDIRHMYDEGLQLNNTPEISRIMWENIPLDSLVYTMDSPNYCEPEAIPQWNGMRGRQCTMGEDDETLSDQKRQNCRHLCRECGYSVKSQNVVTENHCNCKFAWGFRVQCEKCVTVQRQYYCY